LWVVCQQCKAHNTKAVQDIDSIAPVARIYVMAKVQISFNRIEPLIL
jgi:hypothetical protein